MTEPIATILMTAYNRANLLRWGLFSIAKQTCKYPFQIIVLNDGLPDETEKVCEEFKDKLNIKYLFTGKRNINQPKPLWRIPGFAFNIGVKQCDTKYIFLTCAEMFHMGNTIEKMIDVLEQQPLAMVITQGKDDGGQILKTVEEKQGNITYSDIQNAENLHNNHLPFFFGIQRQHYINIGGYDEDFIGIAYDDNDFVMRLVNGGLRHYCINDYVVHLFHPRIYNPNDERSRYNLMIFNRKNSKPGNIGRNIGKEWGKLE